jgi:hypothetical protein
MRSVVRRSCQTMARATGSHVSRSQSTVVSRWFVTPMAARSAPVQSASSRVSCITAFVFAHISSGSCSTHPGSG